MPVIYKVLRLLLCVSFFPLENLVCAPVPAELQDTPVVNLDRDWRLWPDSKAGWQNDPLYLPENVKLNSMPVNPPSGLCRQTLKRAWGEFVRILGMQALARLEGEGVAGGGDNLILQGHQIHVHAIKIRIPHG